MVLGFRYVILFGLLSMTACDQLAADVAPSVPQDHVNIIFLSKPLPSIKPCSDDMVFISRDNFCIDRYEAPNQKGAYPLYAQTAFQAEAYCQNLHKQLCSSRQWYTACVGSGKTYPYGNYYRRGVCNDDKTGWEPVPWHQMNTPAWAEITARLYKGEPSGSRSACVSDDGVYDLTGNVAEWVVVPKAPYGYATKGGYWNGVMFGTPTCWFSNEAHTPNFSSYENGFRCCQQIKP